MTQIGFPIWRKWFVDAEVLREKKRLNTQTK